MGKRKHWALFIAIIILAAGVLVSCGRNDENGENGENGIQPFAFSVEEDDMPAVTLLAWQALMEAPKEGYTLVPTVFGETGVDVASQFVLEMPNPPPAGQLPALTIDGQPQPIITQQENGSFLVAPAISLVHDRLYTFRLSREAADDITWVFQTTPRFEIVSTLPGNQSVNVPVNTGIELHFPVRGQLDISGHFSIEPHVDGRIIQQGATVVFMPTNPLEGGQVYTVTVRAGLGLPGTNEVLAEDYVFSFETASDKPEHPHRAESFHFFNMYAEYPSFEPLQAGYSLSYPWDGTRPVVEIGVHRFDNNADAVSAIENMISAPRWSMFAWRSAFVDTARMTEVARMTITQVQGDRWFEVLQLPDALPPGFYVISASINNEVSDQMILQITDLAVQIVADDDKAIVWVNDMTNGQPVRGARVFDTVNAWETDENGIAVLPRGFGEGLHQLIITAPDEKRCIVFVAGSSNRDWGWGSWWGGPQESNAYWTALQFDRTLFQRSDTLYFWGFAKNRQYNEEITFVDAVLTEGWSWGRISGRDTLHRQTVAVHNGAYSDSIELPHLDPGSYRLTIYHGDIVLGSMFFEVQDFVKPPYQMLVSADKVAAFIGEPLNFTARAEFFEGTPVPELDISYSFWGSGLSNNERGQGVTDIDGNFTVSLPRTQIDGSPHGSQWERALYFTAEATLPEIGWTSQSANVRVFANDINVDARGTRTGENANLTVDVHSITLDRLNDGTAAHWGDYLDKPVAGQNLSVEIVRVYWVPVRIGERYCFIERVVVPRYRHDRHEEVIQRFNMTTDADGHAARDFTVPNRDNESYFARISTTDGFGHNIIQEVFIGRDFWRYYMNLENGEPFLSGAKEWPEGYDLGEEVNLTLMHGAEPLTRGNILFVVAANGIIEYQVGVNPLQFTFGDEHLPNATVFAFHFNGHVYTSNWMMRETLRFNTLGRELVLNVTADQEAYKPGDTATLSITATDIDGRPVQANINLALVDEALFALREYTIDTLNALYRNIPSGIRHTIATHRTFESDGLNDDVWGANTVPGGNGMPMAAAQPTPMPERAEMDMADDGGGSGDTRIRELFKDTAVFAALQTDAQGQASFTFRLPDNITSWRLNVSGISDSLHAGNSVSNIIVTNPMFLHYALNNIFLLGDVPVLGVNAFGTSFAGGEKVRFEVWNAETPDNVIRAEGAAFERINIPLWEMTEEGSHSIIIRAIADNGHSDAVRHNFNVIASHRLVDAAVFYESITPATVFQPGREGLTQITFADKGRGQFLHDLLSMRWTRGLRIEGLAMRREANRLIRQYFADLDIYIGEDSFNPQDYQRPDGGIAMLPYADSDLTVTVRMLPFIKDDINTFTLRGYLYGIFDGGNPGNKIQALYGLAQLQEPVLLYLHAYALVEDLPVLDAAYLAMGFAALGETDMARTLYNKHIVPLMQHIAPYYRVNVAGSRHDVLEATAAAALLAAQLGMPERWGLHEYTVRNHTWDLLVNIQQLAFIVHEIAHLDDRPASITYTLFGEEVVRDLSYGRNYTLRIPAQNMSAFNLISVVGDVSAVALHRVPLENIEAADNTISVKREFFRAEERTPRTTFDQGDLVRVEITVDYSRRDLTGSYIVTDFLPAGLAYTDNSARFDRVAAWSDTTSHWVHAFAEGQRIAFYDHNSRFNNVRTYFYYARVVNPGTFRAQGTMVQHVGARDYMTVGEDTVIAIRD